MTAGDAPRREGRDLQPGRGASEQALQSASPSAANTFGATRSQSAASAKKRGYKALVDRQVVRIVTPGSLVEDTMLTPDENNYLAALFLDSREDKWGLAWADLSTGEFMSTTATGDKLASAILRCSPKEILLPAAADPSSSDALPDQVKELLDTAIPHTCMRTYRSSDSYSSLPKAPPSRAAADVETLAALSAAEQAAAFAILDYIDFTQKSATSLVRAPLHVESSDHMIIDTSAWKALELAKVRRSDQLYAVLSASVCLTHPVGICSRSAARRARVCCTRSTRR